MSPFDLDCIGSRRLQACSLSTTERVISHDWIEELRSWDRRWSTLIVRSKIQRQKLASRQTLIHTSGELLGSGALDDLPDRMYRSDWSETPIFLWKSEFMTA